MSNRNDGLSTRNMYLTGYGRLSWDQVVSILTGLTCAWADYEGFHVKRACPDQAPPYSHLWAWNDDASRLIRIRIDDVQGIVGELSAQFPSGNTRIHRGPEKIEVRVSGCFSWEDDHQVGRELSPDIASGSFFRYEPLLPLSCVFIAGAENTKQYSE